VTSAAIVMVAVFSIFATLSFIEFKQMGVGLAAAILIDATLIRGVLLPATMKCSPTGIGTCRAGWGWLPRRRSAEEPRRGTPQTAPEPAGA
jgi:hypothetical protein